MNCLFCGTDLPVFKNDEDQEWRSHNYHRRVFSSYLDCYIRLELSYSLENESNYYIIFYCGSKKLSFKMYTKCPYDNFAPLMKLKYYKF